MFSQSGARRPWTSGDDVPVAAGPLFSILLPVSDTPPAVLEACLRSVLAQTLGDWELCIADDASTSAATVALLEAFVAQDARIRLVRGAARAGISGNSNRALQMVRGRFVGLLDHDDELAPTALQDVAAALGEFPDARLLYSDEDKIDEAGHRSAPHFKPAWNPDLLRSLNYIGHFLVVEAQLMRDVGGFRPEMDGAQDHDLVLRCVERLAHAQIVHIPKILYHWRAIAGSTASGVHAKPYALEAGRRAIADHLARRGEAAQVHLLPDGRYRVERHLPSAPPRVVIVIPTRDRVELLRACVESVLGRTRYPSFEIAIVDNGSTDPETLAYLDAVQVPGGKVSVLPHAAPFNFSEIVNHGVRATSADVVCLLNNDIEVINADWLREMVSHAVREKVGVVGSMLYYPDDTIQHAGVILGVGGVAGHSHVRMRRGADGYVSRARVVQNLSAVTGACMAFRRDVFDAVGGFDEQLPVAFNDIDFCMRVHAKGWFNVWTPFAELYHHESASRGVEDTPAKQARFALEAAFMRRRWGDVLEHDPYYNPNLSLGTECFELAFPPRPPACRTRALNVPIAA
jgi:GT2 family glycosyltransferase